MDGVEFYVHRIDTLLDSYKQELGEKLYDYPGTWFSESTIKEFYGQKDEIWAIQLSCILSDILKKEPDLSEELKIDTENEILLLKGYIDDIQRERSEHIPTPDDMIKSPEKDGNSLENQAKTRQNDSLERKATKRPSIMDRLAQNIEKVKAKNAEQSNRSVKAHERSEHSER